MKIDNITRANLRNLADSSRAVDSYAGVEPDTLEALLDELTSLEAKLSDATHGTPCEEVRWWNDRNLVRQGARHLVRNMPVIDLVRYFDPDQKHLLAALIDHATEGLEGPKLTREAFKNHVAQMAEHRRSNNESP